MWKEKQGLVSFEENTTKNIGTKYIMSDTLGDTFYYNLTNRDINIVIFVSANY